MCSKAPSDPDSGLPGVLFVLEAPPGPPLPRLSGLSPVAREATAELSNDLRLLLTEWLDDLGGSPDDPPSGRPVDPSIGAVRRARAFLGRAGAELLGGAPEGAVVLGDPLNCLLLRQWRQVLEGPAAVLFIAERPELVAASLQETGRLSFPAGLSIWERYSRSGLAFSEGLPVFVAAGEREALAGRLGTFLAESLGAVVDEETARGLLTPSPRPASSSQAAELLSSQVQLYEAIAALEGPHPDFVSGDLPPESPWVDQLLEARSELAGLRRASEWLAASLEELVANRRGGNAREAGSSYPLDVGDDVASYRAWLEKKGEPLAPSPSPRARPAASPPRFLVILSPAGRSPSLLQGSLDSVLAQERRDLEVVVLGGSELRLQPGEGRLGRLEGEGAPEELARLVESSGTAYVVVLEAGDELAPRALDRLSEGLSSAPRCRLAYGDDDLLDEEGLRSAPRFKPDWSPDRLLAGAYLGSPVVFDRELFSALDGPAGLAGPAGLFSLALRASELLGEGAVLHLAEVLSHRRRATPSPAELAASAAEIRAALERRGEEGRVSPEHRYLGGFRVNRTPEAGHLVSAIIPFRDEAALLASCYRAFVRAPGRVDFELLLVDNGSVQPETEAVLEELDSDRRVRVLDHPGEFNWSTINNDAAGQALGDILLFLNNDAEALSPNWLAQLVATGERSSVGAVGARLLYPDGTLQHGGMAVGVGYGALHSQQGLGGRQAGYLGGAVLTRECSSVTGACLLSRREVFEKVGGFDEQLPTAFGDVDYCLKVRRAGLRVVYDAVAELVHHESKSRGRSGDAPGADQFRHRWREELSAGDPYYNANLSRFDPYCRLPGRDEEEQWERFLSMLREP